MTSLPAYQVDWAQQAGHLSTAAREGHAWYLSVARDLVRPPTGWRSMSAAAPPAWPSPSPG